MTPRPPRKNTPNMNVMNLIEEIRFYLGKKVAFVYRAQKEIRGTKIRVVWGKVTRPHGTRSTMTWLLNRL